MARDPAGAEAEARSRLEAQLAAEARRPVNEDVQRLTRELTRNPGARAVLFYGAGLWDEAGAGTLHDFYVVVDRYRDWAPSRLAAAGGNWLPPNVYYLEHGAGPATVRCKYAVIRLAQFEAAARGGSFTPHIWARFCQPARIVFARDAATTARLIRAFADAVVTFHERTLPLAGVTSIESFWETGLRATYASEIRSERADRAGRLVAANRAAFCERTRWALALCRPRAWLTPAGTIDSELSARRRRWGRVAVGIKRPLQKIVPLGRLIKAGFTFRGGLDYLRWKVEQHSGVVVAVTDFQRRHPILAGLFLLWRVVRRGGVR